MATAQSASSAALVAEVIDNGKVSGQQFLDQTAGQNFTHWDHNPPWSWW